MVATADLGTIPRINDTFTNATLCTTFKIQGKTCQSVISDSATQTALLLKETHYTSAMKGIAVEGNELKLWPAKVPVLYTLALFSGV